MRPLTLAGPSSQTLPTLSPFPSKLYRRCSPFERYNTALGFSQTQRISRNGISGKGLGYFRRQALIVQDKCCFCSVVDLKDKSKLLYQKKGIYSETANDCNSGQTSYNKNHRQVRQRRGTLWRKVGRGFEQKSIGKMKVSHWLNCWSSWFLVGDVYLLLLGAYNWLFPLEDSSLKVCNWHWVVLCDSSPFWLPDSIWARFPFVFRSASPRPNAWLLSHRAGVGSEEGFLNSCFLL